MQSVNLLHVIIYHVPSVHVIHVPSLMSVSFYSYMYMLYEGIRGVS